MDVYVECTVQGWFKKGAGHRGRHVAALTTQPRHGAVKAHSWPSPSPPPPPPLASTAFWRLRDSRNGLYIYGLVLARYKKTNGNQDYQFTAEEEVLDLRHRLQLFSALLCSARHCSDQVCFVILCSDLLGTGLIRSALLLSALLCQALL